MQIMQALLRYILSSIFANMNVQRGLVLPCSFDNQTDFNMLLCVILIRGWHDVAVYKNTTFAQCWNQNRHCYALNRRSFVPECGLVFCSNFALLSIIRFVAFFSWGGGASGIVWRLRTYMLPSALIPGGGHRPVVVVIHLVVFLTLQEVQDGKRKG